MTSRAVGVIASALIALPACVRQEPLFEKPPPCIPLTCQGAFAQCGAISDGCGHRLVCGECPEGLTCGGSGAPNRCGEGECERSTRCEELRAECGLVSDGCDDLLDCGGCPEGEVCNLNNACVRP